MTPLPVYILAGGRSRRFGSDKARALVAGQPLVARVARLAAPVATRITAVADVPKKYADLGLRTIADVHPGLGPLAGLEAALCDLRADESRLLLCSCDIVELRPHWLRLLLDAATPPRQAAAFADTRWHPLPGVYARTIHPLVNAAIAAEHRSMQHLLNQARTARLPLPDDWPALWQVNTRAQWRQYKNQNE